jgi:Cdc6-like AAA superfamily ATPase
MSEPSLNSSKLSALTEGYLPPDLVGRKEQLTELQRLITPLARHRPTKHLWLHGPPGTGKTCAAKMLLNEFEQRYGVRGVYVNCWEADTFHAVLDRATQDLRILGAERLSTVFKMERLEKGLHGRPLLMVLDEFDKPTPRERDSIIYNLCNLPQVVLICITNSRYFYHTLDSRARSRLDAVLVEFQPYGAEEIEAILRHRAELALGSVELGEDTEKRIARLANGDCRVALQTLRQAAVAAEAAGTRRIQPNHIRTGHTLALEAKTRYLLAKLGEQHSLICKIIKERGEISSGDLRQEYLRRCRRARLPPVATRTFSLYLKRLEEMHVVATRRVLGVRGNIRIFRFNP